MLSLFTRIASKGRSQIAENKSIPRMTPIITQQKTPINSDNKINYS